MQLPHKLVTLLDTLINEMAAALIKSGANLHDEREVLSTLVAAGYSAGDAVALGDKVIAAAKAKQPTPENHNV